MRNRIREIIGAETADHLGLAYEVLAPIGDGGKVPDDKKAGWLETLTKHTVSAEHTVSADYDKFFKCWEKSLKVSGATVWTLTLSTRLLIGHGNPSGTDIGLTVHHTWGVPVIPGSALKGLLAHYVETTYGPDPEDSVDSKRAKFAGVTWAGSRIVGKPGDYFEALFGSPPVAGGEADSASPGRQGRIIFHDALYVPENTQTPFSADVLTVHQKPYYDSLGKDAFPSDYASPVPLPFLTVRPNTKFLIALSDRTGSTGWTDLAREILADALIKWGVGGKTSLGYGRGSLSPRSTNGLRR